MAFPRKSMLEWQEGETTAFFKLEGKITHLCLLAVLEVCYLIQGKFLLQSWTVSYQLHTSYVQAEAVTLKPDLRSSPAFPRTSAGTDTACSEGCTSLFSNHRGVQA